MLEDASLLACKPLHCPMDSTLHLSPGDAPLLKDPTSYHCFIGQLLYLIILRHDIIFVVNKLTQHVSQPHQCQLDVAHHHHRYLKSSSGLGILLLNLVLIFNLSLT